MSEKFKALGACRQGDNHSPCNELMHDASYVPPIADIKAIFMGQATIKTLPRRLACLTFAKVCGFRDLLMADDQAAVGAWSLLFTEVLSKQARRFDGRAVLTSPGQLLIEFPCAAKGVMWALEVQRQTLERQQHGDLPQLKLRIAVGVDDVLDVDGVPVATGINDPQFTYQYANPGQTIVSGRTLSMVQSRLKLKIDSAYTPQDEMQLYRVDMQENVFSAPAPVDRRQVSAS